MNDEVESIKPDRSDQTTEGRREKSLINSMFDWLRGRNGETARDQLEEIIEDTEDGETSLNTDERQLLQNILELRGQTVADVMVPRADIIAVKFDAKLEELIEIDIQNSTNNARVSVFGTVRRLREQRWGMVNSLKQYKFMYKFMEDWITAYLAGLANF